jgi:hypothetical protein
MGRPSETVGALALVEARQVELVDHVEAEQRQVAVRPASPLGWEIELVTLGGQEAVGHAPIIASSTKRGWDLRVLRDRLYGIEGLGHPALT